MITKGELDQVARWIRNDTKFLIDNALSSPTAGSIGDLLQGIQASMGLASSGQTWFVAKSGDDGNAGTADAPFLTIQKAHDSASAGDVIVIDSGIYDENVNVTGLDISKDQLRFLAKPPFQVQILNSNAAATSTVYHHANSVEFQNIYTQGDLIGGGCAEGWLIEGGTERNSWHDCAAVAHTGKGWNANGSINFFYNCFGLANGTDFYEYSGTAIFFISCHAIGIFPGAGVGFSVENTGGSTLHNFIDCRVMQHGVGFEVLGQDVQKVVFENCKVSNCTTNKSDLGTGTAWINFNEDSKIATGNSEQDDFKAIYDDSKYLYTTALDGSEVADSIGAWIKANNVKIQAFGTLATGTLNDATPSVEITTTKAGALACMGISLENFVNGDDFDLALQRWDGSAWRTYSKVNITKVLGIIYFNQGAGVIASNIDEISYDEIYLDSTRKLQISLTKNSATDRDFPYFVNKKE